MNEILALLENNKEALEHFYLFLWSLSQSKPSSTEHELVDLLGSSIMNSAPLRAKMRLWIKEERE